MVLLAYQGNSQTNFTSVKNGEWAYVNTWNQGPSTFQFNADASLSFFIYNKEVNEHSLTTSGYNNASRYSHLSANAAKHQFRLAGEASPDKDFTNGDKLSPLETMANSYFRSNQSGNWTTATNWDWSADGVNFTSPSTLVPDHQAQGIHINTDHAIHVDEEISLDRTIIDGALHLQTGGKLQIYNNITPSIRVNNGGMLLINTTQDYDQAIILPGTIAQDAILLDIESGGIVQIGTGINTTGTWYENLALHNKNNWETNAGFTWNNGRTFATSGYTYFPTSSDKIPVFSVGPTPVPAITSAGVLIINGKFDIRTDVEFSALTGARNFRDGITGNSMLTISAGSLGVQQISGSNAILGGSNLILKIGKVLYLENSVHIPEDSSVTIQGYSITNKAGSILSVDGLLDMTDQNITNSGTMLINGHYRTTHPGGFTGSGSSIPSDNVTLNPGSTVEFYASGDQEFKSRSDFSNLLFSGSGEKKPSSGFTHLGTITIQDDAIFNAVNYTIGDSTDSHLVMTGGRYIVNGTGTNPTIRGNYLLTGGTVQFNGSNLTNQTIRNGAYHHIEVTGENVSNSSGNIEIKPNGSFVVKSGAKFTSSSGNASIAAFNDLPDNQIFKVESGGVFRTAVTEGFYGDKSAGIDDKSASVQSSIPHIILEPGSTIEYARSSGNLPLTATDGNQKISFHENIYHYQNLTITGDGEKSAPAVLQIKKDFNLGQDVSFKHGNGLIVFNGTENQRIISENKTAFYDVRNENSANLQIGPDVTEDNESGYDIYIQNSLTLDDNSILNLASGDVTIISDNNGTGRVEFIPPTSRINYENGKFTVERYIPNHPKAWQLLSAATTGGTIKESWQNNGLYQPGKGVNITSPYWTSIDSKGFDGYSSSPSVKWYNQETNLFVGVTSAHNMINEHPAYYLFVRGDRSVISPVQPATEVTLRTRGKLYSPDNQPQPITIKPSKLEALGNPYASAIDFDKLQFVGGQPESSYHIWDPNLTQLKTDGGYSEYGLGAYRTITKVGNDLLATPPVDPDNPFDPYPSIQSGQGFYVRNSSEEESTTVTFTEDAKTTGAANVFRTHNTLSQPVSIIRSNLLTDIDDAQILLDGTLQIFNDAYSAEVDYHDSKKMENAGENLSLTSAKYPLIIERRPFASEGDTIFYNISGMNKKSYTLQIITEAMEEGNHDIYLNDQFKNEGTLLAPGANVIQFDINNDPLSSKKDRFYLTFKKITPPFLFADETAQAEADKINLYWKASNQNTVKTYAIEYAPDQQAFHTLQIIHASAAEHENYHFQHANPEEGIHYYRIKATMTDDSHVYSQTMSAHIVWDAPFVSVYPNPVDDMLQLNFYRQKEGKYHISLIDMEGRKVLSKMVSHTGFNLLHKIPLHLSSKGIYRLKIVKPDGTVQSEKILVK